MTDESRPPSRRRTLRLLASGAALASVAGCLSGGSGGGDTDGGAGAGGGASGGAGTPTAGDGSSSPEPIDGTADAESTTDTPTTPRPPMAARGQPSDICDRKQQGVGGDGIHAISKPAFADDWRDVEIPEQYRTTESGEIDDDAVIIGLERDGDARAYPLSVVWWHEIVNDTFGGPVLVTYCPLCRTGMVARRTVGGESTQFNVTELLWIPPGGIGNATAESVRTFGVDPNSTDADTRDRGNLVMADAKTGSFWSQVLARAICGPRRGDTLGIVPSTTARWGEWRDDHPETDVLLPPPHSELSLI